MPEQRATIRLPLLGAPTNWEEVEQAFAALQVWAKELSAAVALVNPDPLQTDANGNKVVKTSIQTTYNNLFANSGLGSSIRPETARTMGAAWRVTANAGAALESIGFSGGFTTAGTASEIVDARGTWLRLTTGAVAGNSASISPTTIGYVSPDQESTFSARIRLGATITSYRFWCGYFGQCATSSANDDAPDADTLVNNAANDNRVAVAFRFSTVAGDTGFVGVVSDGGGDGSPPPATGIQLTTSQLGTAVASREYLLTIEISRANGTAKFTVKDIQTSETATETITMPLTTMLANMSTTALNIMWDYIYTQAAAARAIDFCAGYYTVGEA